MAGKEIERWETVYRARKAKGLSQIALAELCDLTQNHVSLIERRKLEPKPETVRKLADCLSLDYQTLAKEAYDYFFAKRYRE